MKGLKCANCGREIITLPQHCGQDMIINEETGQLECWMGPTCGYISFDNMICSECRDETCQ